MARHHDPRLVAFVDRILSRAAVPDWLAREARADFLAHLEADVARRIGEGALRNEALDGAIDAFGEEADVRDGLTEVGTARAQPFQSRVIETPRFRVRIPTESVRRDVVHGARALRARPLSSAAAIATLAIGIGLTAAVYSIFDWVVLRPLPYPAAHELVRASSAGTQPMTSGTDLTFSEFTAFSRAPAFKATAAYSTATRVVSGPGLEPTHIEVARIDGDLFGTIDVPPLAGRALDTHDIEREAAVMVVSERLWRSRLAGDPNAVGRMLTVDGVAFTVVGIMPSWRGYPATADVWLPLTGEQREDDDREFGMVGRLSSGASVDAATMQLATLASGLSDATRTAWVDDLQRVGTRDVHRALMVLVWSAGLILLMTTANVAMLTGARSADRAGEMAVRGALGASRVTLLRQLLLEHLLLASLGGMLGLVLGKWLLLAVVSFAPAQLPRLDEIVLDWRIILAGVGITAVAGLLIGALPSLKGSRPDLATTLAIASTPRTTSRVRGRAVLVTVQVTLAIMLTIGAVLFARSLQYLLAIPHGFAADRLVGVDLYLRGGVAGDASQLFPRLLEAAEGVPGVQSAAIAVHLPTRVSGFSMPVDVVGRPEIGSRSLAVRLVTPGYFDTAGIAIRSGRGFAPGDRRGARPVALVNESFTREWLAGIPALGLTLTAPITDCAISVVGVAADVTPGGDSDRPAVYLSMEQIAAGSGSLLVRAHGDAAAIIPALTARIRQAAPGLALDRVSPLSETLAAGRAVTRFNTLLASAFGALALLLAAVGIYGLTANEVASRWRDVAIRMALGANFRTATWSIVRPVVIAVAIGLAMGVAGAIAVSRSVAALLHGVHPLDIPTFVIVCLLLGLVAVGAAASAAVRVLRNQPAATLRA